jgi:integrase
MAYGEGNIYLRGQTWWIQLTSNGRTLRMSAKTHSKEVAKARLRQLREKHFSTKGFFESLLPGRAPVSELIEDLLQQYEMEGKHVFAERSESRWRLHLAPVFADLPAERVMGNDIRDYQAMRLEQGAQPATIYAELQVLHAAYELASKSEPPKVARVPQFTWLPINNARQVFIDIATENKLKDAATKKGLASRVWIEMAFEYGWRRGELMKLCPSNINLADNSVRIDTSKNGMPREVPIASDDLRVLLTGLIAGKQPNEKLFQFDPRREFEAICRIAGVKYGRKGGITMHDARRTSARSKRAAGVPESVVMGIQGWKTAKQFRAYAINDQTDYREALQRERQMKEAAKA